MIKYSISLLCFFITNFLFAQAPENLTTDLLEHTDRVFMDGYPASLSLNQTATAVERYQYAAIRRSRPALGWVMKSNKSNTLQKAYRILVATDPKVLQEEKADLWDSKYTESDNSVCVIYDGKALKPSTVYYWKVKVWDNHGGESAYSQTRCFKTADNLDEGVSHYPLEKTDEHPILVGRNPSSSFIDFGRDAFGQLKLTLSSTTSNDTVTVHFGESCEKGHVCRKPSGSIRYTAYRLPLMKGTHTYYIKFRPDSRNTNMKGTDWGAVPILMPDYIGEVYPFRYVEIECYSYALDKGDIVRQSVHYPFDEESSAFHSSDSVLNKVWDLCKYSIKATSFAGVYVDGDRERIPYEADALINQLSHYSVDREYAMARRTFDHLLHYPTWPTEWICQTVIIAWLDYLYTGNDQMLHSCYDDLKAHALLDLKEQNGLITTQTDKQTPPFLASLHYKGKSIRDIVDWPRGGSFGLGKDNPAESDNYVMTRYNTVVNAYCYEAMRLLSRMAEVVGKDADKDFYAKEAEQLKKCFNKLLYNKKEGCYKDGLETPHAALHASMFPLAFDMVPENDRQSVYNFVRSRGMGCSVYGAQFLLEAVYNMGDARHGLSLLSSTAPRSWYNMLREGSTITMEAWGNRFKPNQDWNHAWGAAAANIIPRKLMGVEPLEPGFKKIRIKLQPDTVRKADIMVPTIRGGVIVSFHQIAGKSLSANVTIPANAMAEVWLPLVSPKYRLSVDNVRQKGAVTDKFVRVTIGSGAHVLTVSGN